MLGDEPERSFMTKKHVEQIVFCDLSKHHTCPVLNARYGRSKF